MHLSKVYANSPDVKVISGLHKPLSIDSGPLGRHELSEAMRGLGLNCKCTFNLPNPLLAGWYRHRLEASIATMEFNEDPCHPTAVYSNRTLAKAMRTH